MGVEGIESETVCEKTKDTFFTGKETLYFFREKGIKVEAYQRSNILIWDDEAVKRIIFLYAV